MATEPEAAAEATPAPEPEVTAEPEEAPASEVKPEPTESETAEQPKASATGFTGDAALLDEPDPWD